MRDVSRMPDNNIDSKPTPAPNTRSAIAGDSQHNKNGYNKKPVKRHRRRKRASVQRQTDTDSVAAKTLGSGGRLSPLSHEALERIHLCTMDILARVGLSEVPPVAADIIIANGGELSSRNRICFPAELVERALKGFRRDITLYARHSTVPLHDPYTPHQVQDLCLQDKRVFVGTGGASPFLVDLHSGEYRESTLKDLYDAARIADSLQNVHFFSRSVVARDISDPHLLDINTAYASLAGTQKHVMVSASDAQSVKAIAELCSMVAGSRKTFSDKPFLSLNVNHVVSPLRFSEAAIDVLICASQLGIPISINTFSQLGASSPVTIAGCIAQTMAETLAGMIFAWIINPNAQTICGPRPMLTDLRTGAMSGGGGEQALLTAGVIQMAQFYGLPNSTIAGATDSKISDAQSGYEKCLSITLAAQTGANLITQACGVQAGLMASSFESYVVDNDMLGSILRTLTPIEVCDTTLDINQVFEAIDGDGHYLGHQETLNRMQSDFLYPDIADRQNHETWTANGSLDIRAIANRRAQDILDTHYPVYIEPEADKKIRSHFDIKLSTTHMRNSSA